MYSSSGQVCPVCAREGAETFLGPDPFASQRLQPDFNVDTIIRKLLPPDVRWHLRRAQCKVWSQGAACCCQSVQIASQVLAFKLPGRARSTGHICTQSVCCEFRRLGCLCCVQFQPNKQDRLASLQAGKPQQASSRTRGAALQMPASEVLCLYICPEVIEASFCGQLGTWAHGMLLGHCMSCSFDLVWHVKAITWLPRLANVMLSQHWVLL